MSSDPERRDPQVGDYMIHIPGEGHDAVFPDLQTAQAAAKAEKRGSTDVDVYILQVVDEA